MNGFKLFYDKQYKETGMDSLISDPELLISTIIDLEVLIEKFDMKMSIKELYVRDVLSLKNLGLLNIPKEIKRLTNLKQLYLDYNNIVDLNPLTTLTQLEVLGLNNNNITDLTPLKNLTQLKDLGLDHNKIEDVTVLGELVNLKQLGLKHNQIKDVTPLKTLTKLKIMNLTFNCIKDFPDLYGTVNKNPQVLPKSIYRQLYDDHFRYTGMDALIEDDEKLFKLTLELSQLKDLSIKDLYLKIKDLQL